MGLLLGPAQLSGGSDALAAVRALVLLQALSVDEALAALLALEGSLAGVDALVPLHLGWLRELFITEFASVSGASDFFPCEKSESWR